MNIIATAGIKNEREKGWMKRERKRENNPHTRALKERRNGEKMK
jgi:hypothetical protein